MEIGIEINQASFKDVYSKFEFAQFVQSKYFSEAMEESLMVTEANIELRTPHAFGGLKGSISSQLLTDLIGQIMGTVSTPKIYGPAVEKGSKPHFPPIEALTGKLEELDKWAKLKGLNAFAVAKSIARKGTKPNNMFGEGLKASQNNVFAIFFKKAQEFVNSLGGKS